MQVSSTSTGAVSGASTTGSVDASNQTLGQDAFLQLLVTQMKNQDPSSPMDNQAFLAQLAQFSSLEQMQNLNGKLDSSLTLTQSLSNTAAAGYIGRSIRATADTIDLSASGNVDLGYTLVANAATATVTITDSSGNLVRTLNSSETAAGEHSLSWDGRDATGTRELAGSYTFKVSALDESGASVAIQANDSS